MLRELKAILNSYTDEELERISLWVNSNDEVKRIIVQGSTLDLITDEAEIKIIVDDEEYFNW